MSIEDDTEFNRMIDLFYSNEEKYVEELDILNHLRLRLLTHNKRDDPILTEEEINHIFLNSGSIYDFNSGLLRRLNRMRWKGEQHFIEHVGGLLVKDIQFFKMYGQFIEHVRTAEHRFKDLCQRNSKFKRFIDFHDDLYQKPFSLLLYAPLHHLPEYIQTFGELHQVLAHSNHHAQDSMHEAVNKMQGVMDAISEQAAATKRSNKVVEIQRKLGDRVALVAASRQAYRQATVKIKDLKQSSSVQTAELVLFNDCIIYCTSGFFGGTSLKGVMTIAGLEITPIISQNNTFRLYNELTKREWEVITLEDREYIPWIANLLQVYKRYYGIYDGNDKRSGPQHSNTVSLKVLHPDDFENEIRNKPSSNPRYIDKPSPITQAAAQEILDERRKDRQQAAAAASPSITVAGGDTTPSHAHRPTLQPPTTLQVNVPSGSGSAPIPPRRSISVRKLTDDDIWKQITVFQGWERLFDETNNAFYFEHFENQLTQWEAPQVVIDEFNRIRKENDDALAAATEAVAQQTPHKPSRPVPPTPSAGGTRIPPATPRRPSLVAPSSPVSTTGAIPPRPPKVDAPIIPASPSPQTTTTTLQPPQSPTPPVPPQTPVVTPPIPPTTIPQSPTPPVPPTTIAQPPAVPESTTAPAATSDPTSSPTPGGNAPPPRPAFLAAISGGAPALRKVESTPEASGPTPPPAGGLLGAIKGGITLKKVTDEDRQNQRAPASGAGGITLASNLQKSLANYRKFVQADESDDDDDEDW